MACLLLAPQGEQRGIVTFTTGERDDLISRYPDLRTGIEKLKSRYIVGLHHNWHDFNFCYDPLYDFSLAGSEDLIPAPGTQAPPLVPLDACNFVPPAFAPGDGEKFWDVLFVARAVYFKGIPEFFAAIRALYDQGHRLRVLFLCPVPRTGDTGVRKLYESLFNPAERQRFSFITMTFDYPFPFDLATLAHFYRASRVFVHSAPDERRCRVAAYAWATGMPVVGMRCVGSILSAKMRKPPYFFEINDYAQFPRAILLAVEASHRQDDFSPVEAEVTTRDTIIALRGHLDRIAETIGFVLSPRQIGSSQLDIRMGRHHGLASGGNRLEQDPAAFIRLLQNLPDADLAQVAALPDPEATLAARYPQPPRKVPFRWMDLRNRVRATSAFRALRRAIKGR